jgi:hypothetical protein
VIKRTLTVLAAILPLLMIGGCEDPVTMENFDLIAEGMDLNEVENIMGGSGELQEASGIGIGASGLMEGQGGSGATKDYLWGDENLGILVKFKSDQVMFKAKYGL